MPARTSLKLWPGFHFAHRGLHEAKDAVEINAERSAPLALGHLGDGRILRRPHAVIHHQAMDPTQRLRSSGHEKTSVLRAGKLLAKGDTLVAASTLFRERLSLR